MTGAFGRAKQIQVTGVNGVNAQGAECALPPDLDALLVSRRARRLEQVDVAGVRIRLVHLGRRQVDRINQLGALSGRAPAPRAVRRH